MIQSKPASLRQRPAKPNAQKDAIPPAEASLFCRPERGWLLFDCVSSQRLLRVSWFIFLVEKKRGCHPVKNHDNAVPILTDPASHCPRSALVSAQKAQGSGLHEETIPRVPRSSAHGMLPMNCPRLKILHLLFFAPLHRAALSGVALSPLSDQCDVIISIFSSLSLPPLSFSLD